MAALVVLAFTAVEVEIGPVSDVVVVVEVSVVAGVELASGNVADVVVLEETGVEVMLDGSTIGVLEATVVVAATAPELRTEGEGVRFMGVVCDAVSVGAEVL